MMDMINGSPPWGSNTEPSMESPYQDLAIAIVKTAVKDYQNTLRAMWKTPKSQGRKRELLHTKLELESFFYSGDYGMYCRIPPEEIIRLCRMRAVDDAKKSAGKRRENTTAGNCRK